MVQLRLSSVQKHLVASYYVHKPQTGCHAVQNKSNGMLCVCVYIHIASKTLLLETWLHTGQDEVYDELLLLCEYGKLIWLGYEVERGIS